jgi:transposase
MDLIGLSGWQFPGPDYENEFDQELTALPPHVLTACPACKSSQSFFRHGQRKQLFFHTPTKGKRLGLMVVRQRYRCTTCSKVFYQPLPEMDERRSATKLLIAYIQKRCIKYTFQSIAEEVGVSEATVRSIFSDHVKELDKQSKWSRCEWIGIDEVKVGKISVFVVTDLKKHNLLDMMETKKNNSKRYLSIVSLFIEKADQFAIRAVCMDMTKDYRLAVKRYLPNARIVIDKFHVIRLVVKKVDTIRKATARKLKLKRHQRKRLLNHARKYILTNRHTLDDEGIRTRNAWFASAPELKTAYYTKEEFLDIYNVSDRAEAERRYRTWKEKIIKENPSFLSVTKTVDNWYNEIFNYFDFPEVTNGYTEAINRLIKFQNRIGNGYSFEVLRAKCLFSLGHYRVETPSYQRRWPQRDTLGTIDQSASLNQRPPLTTPQGKAAKHRIILGVPISTLIEKLEQGTL